MEEPSLDIEKDVMKQNEQFANQTQMEIEQDSKIHVENLQKKLANGSSFRYLILALCCLYVIGGSMAVDSFGSLSSEMKQKLSLSETEFGTLIASGILPNIAVVFIGGKKSSLFSNKGKRYFLFSFIMKIFLCSYLFRKNND